MGDHKRDTMLANFAISGGPQVSAAMDELLAERDRLRAVVDAVRAWRDLKMRFHETDESDLDRLDQIETARQVMWLALAKWEEALDGSGDIGGTIDRYEAFAMDSESYEVPVDPTSPTYGDDCGGGREIDDTKPMRDYVTPEEMGNPDWYPPDNWRLG